MSRYSSASFADDASTNRFHVWDDPANDSFNAVELAENWDKLDAIIGRPTGDAAAWPSTQGVGSGIWKEIELLRRALSPIGDMMFWFFPFTGSETSTQVEAQVAASCPGWVLADGRKVLAAEHEFPGVATDIYIPDMRNAYPLGAMTRKVDHSTVNASVVPGTAGTTLASADLAALVASPQGAPTMTRFVADTGNADMDGVIRGKAVGSTGSNASGSVPLAIPDHYHLMDHTHVIAGQTVTISGTVDVTPHTTFAGLVSTTGTTFNRPTSSHTHTFSGSQALRQTTTSLPRGEDSPSVFYDSVAGTSSTTVAKNTTSLQVLASGATGRTGKSAALWPASAHTPGNSGGSDLSANITLDRRPRSVAGIWLVKVKQISSIS